MYAGRRIASELLRVPLQTQLPAQPDQYTLWRRLRITRSPMEADDAILCVEVNFESIGIIAPDKLLRPHRTDVALHRHLAAAICVTAEISRRAAEQVFHFGKRHAVFDHRKVLARQPSARGSQGVGP